MSALRARPSHASSIEPLRDCSQSLTRRRFSRIGLVRKQCAMTTGLAGGQVQESQEVWQRVVLLQRQLHRAVTEEDYELAKVLLKATQDVETYLPKEQQELVEYVAALWSGATSEQFRAIEYLWNVLDMQGLPAYLCSSLAAGTQWLICPAGCREPCVNQALEVFVQWLWKPCPVTNAAVDKAMETVRRNDPDVGAHVSQLHLLRVCVTKSNLEAKMLSMKAKQLAVTTLREELRQGGTVWRSVQEVLVAIALGGSILTPVWCSDVQDMLNTAGMLCSSSLVLLGLFSVSFHIWRDTRSRKLGLLWPEQQSSQQAGTQF